MVQGCPDFRAPNIKQEHSSLGTKAGWLDDKCLYITVRYLIPMPTIPSSGDLRRKVDPNSSERMSWVISCGISAAILHDFSARMAKILIRGSDLRKFARNIKRDASAVLKLKAEGWRVLILWECETKQLGTLRSRLRTFLRRGGNEPDAVSR